MKKIFIILILFIFITINKCNASVYVIHNNDTKHIYTMSEKDDTEVPDGMSKKILKGNFKNYQLDYPAHVYKYVDNKFILDIELLTKETNEQIKQDTIDAFNPQVVKAELFDLFEDQLDQFTTIYPFLSDLIDYKDFTRMKRYIDAILASDANMKQLYDSFTALILKHGIDLNEY